VGHLLAQGIERRLWQIAGDNSQPPQNETLERYLSQNKVTPEGEGSDQ
jgi:curli production assembly/transport component CsgG